MGSSGRGLCLWVGPGLDHKQWDGHVFMGGLWATGWDPVCRVGNGSGVQWAGLLGKWAGSWRVGNCSWVGFWGSGCGQS